MSSGKIGRIPSFYTTRSILNLSGLSVADPIPVVEEHLHHYMTNPNYPDDDQISPQMPTGHSSSNDIDHYVSSSSKGKNISFSEDSNNVNLQGTYRPPRDSVKFTTKPKLQSEIKDRSSNNSLKDPSSDDDLTLFASVPAPDTTLVDSPRSSLLSSRYAQSGSGSSSLKSPRSEKFKQIKREEEDDMSLYASVPAPDTILVDSPRSNLVSSRYTSHGTPRAIIGRKSPPALSGSSNPQDIDMSQSGSLEEQYNTLSGQEKGITK
jgi:hypothetical protein